MPAPDEPASLPACASRRMSLPPCLTLLLLPRAKCAPLHFLSWACWFCCSVVMAFLLILLLSTVHVLLARPRPCLFLHHLCHQQAVYHTVSVPLTSGLLGSTCAPPPICSPTPAPVTTTGGAVSVFNHYMSSTHCKRNSKAHASKGARASSAYSSVCGVSADTHSQPASHTKLPGSPWLATEKLK